MEVRAHKRILRQYQLAQHGLLGRLVKDLQEPTCQARWIATASGYLQLLLIFNIRHLQKSQEVQLTRIIACILSAYLPSFSLIHLRPTAAEDPAITFFQRDLLLAYQEVHVELADIALKYFREHALQ